MKTTTAAGGMARRLAVESGVLPLLGRLTGGIGAILMLHRVRRAPWSADPGATVNPDTLVRIIRHLRKHGYDIVSLDEAVTRAGENGNRRNSDRFACLTFDDGYRDNHDVLWPIAQSEDAPIAIYLTTGYIDRTHPAWWLLLEAAIAARETFVIDGKAVPAKTAAEKSNCYKTVARHMPANDVDAARRQMLQWLAGQDLDADALLRDTFMDWPMIKAMSNDARVTFGGHTASHARLSALDSPDAQREIEICRQKIADELGASPRHFAFPFGLKADSGPRDIALVRAAGFTSIVHAYGGPVRRGADPMNLPRIAFGGTDKLTDLAVRLSGLRTFLRAI